MKNMKKILVLVLAALLLVAVSVAGTVAYLTDRTDAVANTFTPTTFDIALTESVTPWKNSLVPGTTYDKDPTVTVKNKDIKIWLFVEVTDTATQYLQDCKLFYHQDVDVAGNWTQGDGPNVPNNIWYRTVEASETDTTIELIQGSKVTVSPTLSLQQMPNADVTLSFKAYACQYENLTDVKDAWNAAKDAIIYPAP